MAACFCCLAGCKTIVFRFVSTEVPRPHPVAGSEQLYHQAKPMLDVMGKASFFLGEVRGPDSAPHTFLPTLPVHIHV